MVISLIGEKIDKVVSGTLTPPLLVKVSAADVRVKKLREEVPLALTEAIQKELLSCRPSAVETSVSGVMVIFIYCYIKGGSDLSCMFGTVESEVSIEGMACEDESDVEIPDLKVWKQLKCASNKVPSVM